jgi:hypothetical protein
MSPPGSWPWPVLDEGSSWWAHWETLVIPLCPNGHHLPSEGYLRAGWMNLLSYLTRRIVLGFSHSEGVLRRQGTDLHSTGEEGLHSSPGPPTCSKPAQAFPTGQVFPSNLSEAAAVLTIIFSKCRFLCSIPDMEVWGVLWVEGWGPTRRFSPVGRPWLWDRCYTNVAFAG